MGPEVAERTAAEIWAVLTLLDKPPLLWNVFPFHSHEKDDPFTNRKFTTRELREVDELNAALISWLGIRRIVSIGQDAASYAAKFGVEVVSVRHPSYGASQSFAGASANCMASMCASDAWRWISPSFSSPAPLRPSVTAPPGRGLRSLNSSSAACKCTSACRGHK
ncbi:uracil-DNA glycosylase [Variovorax sp. DXTD-1]|uniref:uracil-DNA glycosylase n=1 Tax=Variovorax sp. DXTD-1 TaxID=2495592 RepID=UPI0021AE69F7|nr:uracil-DNA glycosylase [Variovorax sp. DXTD-1]